MTRERFEQILFAHISDEVVRDMLNEYVLELESNNAKLREQVADACMQLGGAWVSCTELRELVLDMWAYITEPVSKRNNLKERLARLDDLGDRMRELGVEVDE